MEKYNSLFNSRARADGGLNALVRMTALAVILIAALISGGCLVGNDDFNKARLERDEYRDELARLHESNDMLKREVLETYESCDLISTQLTVMAAMNIHERYTANLGRPVLPPPLPATTTAPATRTTRTPRATRVEQSGQQGSSGRTATGGSRTPSGSGSGRTGSSGGTRTSPPPPPPANTGGGGGSIDWGF